MNTPAPTNTCRQCGGPMASNAPEGLCARCLLSVALKDPEASDPETEATVEAGSAEAASALTMNPAAFVRVRYVGDYELQEEIARGGMGVVWKARQASLNRTVAVKMILAGKLAGEAEVQRFHREAEAAANLQHPNIVAIHEVGEHEGQHYYSMDYVEGRDLGALVRESGPLLPSRAAECLKTIAEAVHFAHQRGTLHRDIKPQNVLMDAAGVPRVTDFGLAKFIERDDSLTQTGAAMGSPSYMPPEQAAGRLDQVGPHSDVYSLGAILYELLTGRPPFRARTAMATMREVMESDPVSPRKVNPAVPSDMETICLKCLEKSPQRRYPTARDLADDLGRFLKREPILARPVSASRKVEQWAKRNSIFLAGVAALAFLAVSTVAYWLWQQNQYLVRHAAHQDVARASGARTAFVHGMNMMALSLFYIAIIASFVFNKRLHNLPVSKLFTGTRPKEAMSPSGLAVYEVIGVVSILFGLFYLAKLIDAMVWEGLAMELQFWMTYPLISFGVTMLSYVRRERRTQLFGRDFGASRAPADLNDRVIALLRAHGGVQIPAIKLYRKATGCNLPDASAAVFKIAQQSGIPWTLHAKIDRAKFARNLAITAAAMAIAWYLLPSACRASALTKFFGGWIMWAFTMNFTRFNFKGFARNFLAIVAAQILFFAILLWQPGPVWTFLCVIIGMCAFNTAHKTAIVPLKWPP